MTERGVRQNQILDKFIAFKTLFSKVTWNVDFCNLLTQGYLSTAQSF